MKPPRMAPPPTRFGGPAQPTAQPSASRHRQSSAVPPPPTRFGPPTQPTAQPALASPRRATVPPVPVRQGPAAVVQRTMIVGEEVYTAANAHLITNKLLETKTNISKTQISKNPYGSTAREWASHKQTVKFSDWTAVGSALKSKTETARIDRQLNYKPFDHLNIALTGYILDFLDDRSLAIAESVSKKFQTGAMVARLPPSRYGKVTAEGKRENVDIEADDHWRMAVDYYRRARRTEQIVLYRQFHKKARLTTTEIDKFTVSSFPWTPEKTAAWILGGMQARKQFVIITDVTLENITSDTDKRVAILARELGQLLLSGYTVEIAQQGGKGGHGLTKISDNLYVLRPTDLAMTDRTRLEWSQIWDRKAKTFDIVTSKRKISPDEIVKKFKV